MSDSIRMEADFFWASLLSGGMIVIVYDVLRIFRRVVRHRPSLIAFEDLLFWLSGGTYLFLLTFQMNNGNVRAYSFLGATFGMLICHLGISPFLVTGCTFILLKVKAIFVFIHMKISRLFRRFHKKEKKNKKGLKKEP